MALYLRHEVHHDHHHNQHGGAAQIEGHVEHDHQKLRQQADQRDVGRAKHRQTRQHAVDVVRCLLPGQQTANYIDGVLTRLTVFGSAYIALVCLLPQFLVVMFNVPFYLGGTSMLIVVVVVMDFMAQVQSHLMSHQYEGVMKKANLGSLSPAGRVR